MHILIILFLNSLLSKFLSFNFYSFLLHFSFVIPSIRALGKWLLVNFSELFSFLILFHFLWQCIHVHTFWLLNFVIETESYQESEDFETPTIRADFDLFILSWLKISISEVERGKFPKTVKLQTVGTIIPKKSYKIVIFCLFLAFHAISQNKFPFF